MPPPFSYVFLPIIIPVLIEVIKKIISPKTKGDMHNITKVIFQEVINAIINPDIH